MDGSLLGGGIDVFSIIPVVSPLGRLSSHHSVLFHVLVLIINLLILPLLYLLNHAILNSIPIKIGREENIHYDTSVEGQAQGDKE